MVKTIPFYFGVLTGALVLGAPSLLPAAEPAATGTLHIDIPVALKEARVVFNMDHLAFEGDNPTGLNYMKVLHEDFVQAKTHHSMVAIFHGEAGYMLLDDARYNAVRHTSRGNPYKAMIATLQDKGVRFELCAVTARGNGWTNEDVLSGVKVVTSANLRIIQLAQDGYVQIQP